MLSIENYNSHKIFEFKAVIFDSSPLIWRGLKVSGAASFFEFHVALADVFGWTDYPPHIFKLYFDRSKPLKLRLPFFPKEKYKRNEMEAEIYLGQYFRKPGQKVKYKVFGEMSLKVYVELKSISDPEDWDVYPQCTDGKNASIPQMFPEIYDFNDYLRILENPNHILYEEIQQEYQYWKPKPFNRSEVIFGDPREALDNFFAYLATTPQGRL